MASGRPAVRLLRRRESGRAEAAELALPALAALLPAMSAGGPGVVALKKALRKSVAATLAELPDAAVQRGSQLVRRPAFARSLFVSSLVSWRGLTRALLNSSPNASRSFRSSPPPKR